MRERYEGFSEVAYPDHAIRVSCHDDILCVPLVHLGHTAADDLLAPACECVHTHDRVAIDAPHMDVCASTGHNVPLRRRGGHMSSSQNPCVLKTSGCMISEVTYNLVFTNTGIFNRSFKN